MGATLRLAEEVGAWALYLRSVTVCDDARAGHACPPVAEADRSE
ncbi:MAG: hypothetical protein AB7I04_09635 [Pseudomonadales bacterium]